MQPLQLIPFHIQDTKNLLRYVMNMSSHSSCILFQFLRLNFTGQEQEAHKEQEGKQKEGVSLCPCYPYSLSLP